MVLRPIALVFAAVLTAQPLVNEDVLEPSVRNEVRHSSAATLPIPTNGLNRTQIAIGLVSAQKGDGRWFVGTNDVTSAAIELLKELLK